MKTLLPLLVFMMLCIIGTAQITTPQIKANFGIDADLRDNFINTTAIAGTDDWFLNGNAGGGKFVIDTNGAAALLNGYISNPLSRNKTVIRNMSFPAFSYINRKLLMDAVFVRDFHGDDSTIFASGSNKNGMNPSEWSTPEAQSVPDKNEILDVYMHVRRDGRLPTDSLWMFGAVSIENTTGNRYFDFEMYQTPILYNKATNSFSGYGPDAGHTSWEFDAAGNIIKAGDIILTAEYSSSSLTLIEPRIWVNRASLSITPATFKWSGQFDGATNSAGYGYASILPKTEGAFYSGLQNSLNSWGGAYGIVRGDNSLVTDYTARQFMEFSVNLTKLGLDPVTLLGGSTCDMPFQKVMVKTRASTSFTAALKDFVAPFSAFNASKASLFTTIPIFCGVNGVSNIKITNAIPTSVYTWETIGGHFADTSNKTSIYVDEPGQYIVHQRLSENCPVYASDTITIRFSASCGILLNSQLAFTGKLNEGTVQLSWNHLVAENVQLYTIEKSTDGIHFDVFSNKTPGNNNRISAIDPLQNFSGPRLYYRLAIKLASGETKYSPAILIDLKKGGIKNKLTIAPNPVKSMMQVQVFSSESQSANFVVLDAMGNTISSIHRQLEKGSTTMIFSDFENKPSGIYSLKVIMNNEVLVKRFLLTR